MLLDVSLLRRARVENVERLAKALGLKLPRRPAKQSGRSKPDTFSFSTSGRDASSRDYANQLVNGVMRELRRDAMRSEFDRLSDF